MITVRFNEIEEFLEELEKDAMHVDQGIVRVTNLFRPSSLTPAIRRMSLVATALVGIQLVRLERYVGDLWGTGADDEKVMQKATELRRRIDERVAELGLEIRAGILEHEAQPA